jgi:hypothetical protein
MEAWVTPERLNFLIESCFRHQRGRAREDLETHYVNIARFFGVDPLTLRRWRRGEKPIPRPVEVVMEIFHAYPQVTADAVNNVIRVRDDGASKA